MGRRGFVMLTSGAKSATAAGGAKEAASASTSRRIRAKGTRVTRAECWAGGQWCEYSR